MTAVAHRIKKTFADIPKNIESAGLYIRQIGSSQKQIKDIEKKLLEDIASLKMKAENKITAEEKIRDNAMNALFAFASGKRATLTRGGKSVLTRFGNFGWRTTPQKVVLKKSESSITAFMMKRPRFKKFLSITVKLKRNELRTKKPTIPGISYEQHEEFFVTPRVNEGRKKTEVIVIDA